MPLMDTNLILMNKTDLDSGTDGAGSGADPTASGGAVVNLVEETEMALLVILKPSDTGGEPGDADTLTITLELSGDGGSSWPDVTTSRSILGAEVADDLAAGDEGVALAFKFRVPEADAAQDGVVKARLTTVASDTSNWGVHASIVPPQSVRQEWLNRWLDIPA